MLQTFSIRDKSGKFGGQLPLEYNETLFLKQVIMAFDVCARCTVLLKPSITIATQLCHS